MGYGKGREDGWRLTLLGRQPEAAVAAEGVEQGRGGGPSVELLLRCSATEAPRPSGASSLTNGRRTHMLVQPVVMAVNATSAGG